jgi:1-acyl-sn-glycerol-3-phosphate acyltransferase
LFLDRKDTKQGLKIILKAIDYVKEGISIFVFPEGTRSKDGKMIPFKAGAFKISTKTGCPIIPVVLSGTADIFENHLPKIKKG